MLVFPHPLFPPLGVRGLSLLIGPVVTGLALWKAGSIARLNNGKPLGAEGFWFGAAFGLGFALVRLLCAN